MKIILLQDIPGVGRKNDIKDLKPGFARSFIINHRAAVATPQAMQAREIQQKKKDTEQLVHNDLLEKTIAQINGKKITLHEKINEAGHLYQKISKETILAAIQKEWGVSLPENVLVYEKPIKEKGDFPLSLHLLSKNKGEIIVSVEPA